jgi:tape measure domain-containing protein
MAQSYQVDIVTKVTNISSVARLEKALKNLASDQDKVDKAARRAAAGQQKFGRAAASAGSSAKGAAGGVKSLGAAFAVASAKITAIVGTIKAFTSAMGAAFERDAAEQRLRNITSSAGEYNAAIAAASQLSAKFGQTQTETTKALGDTYSRLSGLGYGLKEVTEIYDGFNTIALQSGVAAEDAAGAFFQLSQALGSGTLQGDELRSILERMPQLTQALAEQMNVSAATIKTLGSEGKITGDVIYKALSNAAAAGGSLEGKLNQQQLAFMALSRAANEFFVVIGRALSPAVIAIAEKFGQYMNYVGQVFQYLATTHGPAVSAAFQKINDALTEAFGSDWLQQFTTFLQNVALKAVEMLVGAFTKVANEIAFVIKKAKELSQNPVFKALAAGWGGVAKALGLNNDKLNEFTEGQKAATAATAATVQQYSKLPEQQKRSADLKKEEAAATKALAAAEREYQAALGSEQGDIDRKLQVTQAVLAAERQINDAKLQQANSDLQAATNAAERESAIKRIYKITVENAKLEYEATVASAMAEQRKVEAAERHAKVLATQIQAEVALQRSKKIYNEAQNQALASAQKLVDETQKNLDAQTKITSAVLAGAKATRDKEIEAAKVTMQMQLQTSQQNQTNAAIQQGAAAMGQLADNAQRAASAAKGIGGGSGGGGMGWGMGSSGSFSSPHTIGTADKFILDERGNIIRNPNYAQDIEKSSAEKRLKMLNEKSKKAYLFDMQMQGSDYQAMAASAARFGGQIGPEGSQLYQEYERWYGGRTRGMGYQSHYYADGGYVTGPTQAVVGEGGEPEYIIPASKMDSAMQRYGTGMRGSSVIPDNANVSINYSGSTVDMGGTSYINKGDVNGIVSQAVNATLTTLKKSPRARLEAGMR